MKKSTVLFSLTGALGIAAVATIGLGGTLN